MPDRPRTAGLGQVTSPKFDTFHPHVFFWFWLTGVVILFLRGLWWVSVYTWRFLVAA